MSFCLNSKKIVLTGAGSGIGQCTSILLNNLGAEVIMLDISESGLNDTESKMSGDTNVHYLTDLSNIDGIALLVKQIVEKHGPVDGLVHCAGISSRKPLNVLKKDGFAKVMDINFFSFVELVKQFSKKGRMNDASSIVVMSSISSIRGYKAKTEYCVSKAAIDAFVRCAALELAERRIRVNSVMPAEVLTPLAMKARDVNNSLGLKETKAPLGPTEPNEVANLIAFLLSDATRTITGTSILIDGGATL